jgi:hypothetical protein
MQKYQKTGDGTGASRQLERISHGASYEDGDNFEADEKDSGQ